MRIFGGRSPKFYQEGADFVVRTRFGVRRATMPEGWLLSEVHPSVLKVVEWILFANIPSLMGHVVSLEDLLQLEHADSQGARNLLAFSGGADSTAALRLLEGSDFLPVYLRRSYGTYERMPAGPAVTVLRSRPFLRLRRPSTVHLCGTAYLDEVIESHGAVVVENDLELLSTDAGGRHGFQYGYGYGAILALLAHYYGAGAVSFGSVLETVWMGGGGMNPVHDQDNTFVDITIDPTSVLSVARSVFAVAGLEICQPVAGCSEAITTRLVESARHVSCPFGYDDGSSCDSCFKCFRKQQLCGRRVVEPLHPRVRYALSEDHLTMAVSVIEGCRRVDHFPDEIKQYMAEDTSWCNRHFDESLSLLCSPEIAEHVRKKLAEYGVEKMSPRDTAAMKSFLQ